jgi:hypothetical protein
MRKSITIPILLLIFFGFGCAAKPKVVVILPFWDEYPLEKEIIYVDLAGRWTLEGTGETWEFEQGDDESPEDGHELYITEVGKVGIEMGAVTFELENEIFLGLVLVDMDDDDDVGMYFFIPGFTFYRLTHSEESLMWEPFTLYRLTHSEESLMLEPMSAKGLREIDNENPGSLRYEILEDRLVLFMSAEQIVTFLREHHDDERLFDDKRPLRLIQKVEK